MTPNISTSAFCGDEVIKGETDFSGLNLVDFSFVPHFGNIPCDLNELKQYSQDHQTVVYASRDGGEIVVNDDDVKCIGDVIRVG